MRMAAPQIGCQYLSQKVTVDFNAFLTNGGCILPTNPIEGSGGIHFSLNRSCQNSLSLDISLLNFLNQNMKNYFFFALAFTLRPASISRRIVSERVLIRFSKRKSSIRFRRSFSMTKMILGFSVGMVNV